MKLVAFLVAALVLSTAKAAVDLKELKCLVCRATVDEFSGEVNKIDPSQEIEVGQYRLDHKGNNIQKKVRLATSEVHLSELLEATCKKMEDYVRATYKSNGQLTLMKLMQNGNLNPLMNEVDIVQDGDLNKSLEHFCTEIVNDYEEEFIDAVRSQVKDVKNKICLETTDYCRNFEFEDEDEDPYHSEADDDKDEL